MVEKKMSKIAAAMGTSTRDLEWFCKAWRDLHMGQKFSGIGSYSPTRNHPSASKDQSPPLSIGSRSCGLHFNALANK